MTDRRGGDDDEVTTGRPRCLGWALLGLAVVIGTVGQPAVAGAAEGPLILHLGASGGGLPPAVRQEVRDRLGLTEEEMTPAVPFVDYVFEGALLWPTDAAARLCPPGREPVSLPPLIAHGEEALRALAFSDAEALLAVVPEDLACVADPVDGATLARAAFLLGYARFMAGDRDGATEAFWMAAQLDPDVAWDNDYPPEVQQTFNNAVLDALRTSGAAVAFSEEFWKRAEDVFIDGAAVAESGETRPGLHRVTLPSRAPGGVAAAVRFTPGETTHLWPVEDLISGLMAGEALGEPALAALVAALQRHGAPDAYVVEPASRRMFRFHVESRQLRELPTLRPQPVSGDRPVVQRRPLPQLPQPTLGGTLIVAGGITTIVGLTMGIALRQEALEIYDEVYRDPDLKGRYRDDFNRAKGGMTAGFIIAGLGGVSVAVGIPVVVLKARAARGPSASLHVTLGRTPDGAGRTAVWLTGRW